MIPDIFKRIKIVIYALCTSHLIVWSIDHKIQAPPFVSHPQVWQVARCRGWRHQDLGGTGVRRPGSLAKGFGFWPGQTLSKSSSQTCKYEIQPSCLCTCFFFGGDLFLATAMIFHEQVIGCISYDNPIIPAPKDPMFAIFHGIHPNYMHMIDSYLIHRYRSL